MDERKRELKRAFKQHEREHARQMMMLDESQVNELLDHLDRELGLSGCDHTLRLTSVWAEQRDVDMDQLAVSLAEFGGYCDCEVLANLEPEEIF